MDVRKAGMVFCDPTAYADEPRFYQACALLRREDPVHRVETEGFNPFWVVTRHADLLEIERDSSGWLAAPRPALGPASQDAARESIPIRTLVQMDPPDHTRFRQVGSAWFRPGRLRALEPTVRELARRWIDRMADLGGECDFVTDVALHFPLYVIMSILGLPEDDYPRMLKLTQEMFGSSDPELAREEDMITVLLDFFEYFQALTGKRRAEPTDDLASAIANAEIDGSLLGDLEAAGYYVIVATAGHDTTSASIAGGLHALMSFPDQLDRLRSDPSLVPTAVEEMIRWVSPVKQFMRTAAVDQEVGGVAVPAGGSVLLSFPSANRDEDVFEDPDRFDAGRDPNRHLAFGFGAHFCLGAQLARLEARVFFSELLPRLRHVEPAGDPAYMETLFVGGPKHLPIHYELAGP
jgi:cytochrome P450